jgi:hypothetical protein
MANFDSSARTARLAGRGRRLGRQAAAEAQDRFLVGFAETGIISAACRRAGIHRSLISYWREKDPVFRDRYAIAELEADDRIREEIWRRSVVGNRRTRITYRNGESTAVEESTTYSDSLLALLARARLAEHRKVDPARGIEQGGHQTQLSPDEQQLFFEVVYFLRHGELIPEIESPLAREQRATGGSAQRAQDLVGELRSKLALILPAENLTPHAAGTPLEEFLRAEREHTPSTGI